MCIFPWRMKWSSWAWLGGPFVLTLGIWGRSPGNLGAVGWNWDCSATAWALKGTLGCVWTAMSCGVLHNLMTRIGGTGWCVEEMELAQGWRWTGVGCIHLLYCTVAKVWLWTLPLARGGVSIWLYWGPSLPVDAIVCLWSVSMHPHWNGLHPTVCKVLHWSWCPAPENYFKFFLLM